MKGESLVCRRLSARQLAQVPALDPLAFAPVGAAVGAAWAVSVAGGAHDPVRAALWRVCIDGPGLAGLGTPAAAGPSALKAFSDAQATLTALPWGWSALPTAAPAVVRVDDLSVGLGTGPPPSVDGRSLTLAALLALASHHYGCPLSNGVVASADLSPSGQLVPVEGVADKVAALRELLPGLQGLVVAKDQADEWARALRTHDWANVQVFGYESAAEAVLHHLDPAARVRTLSASDRDRQIAHLRYLLLNIGMVARVNWPAVADFAGELLSPAGGAPASADRAHDLSLIRLVAARYARRELFTPEPALCEAAVAERSPRLRALKLSQIVQQFADLAAPLPAVVAATNPGEYPGVFGHRVRGAWCRWLLAAGGLPFEERARVALAGHRDIIEQLLRDEDWSEISHSLSALLALAGALEDADAYAFALHIAKALAHNPDMSPTDLAFIRLARARAALWAPGADRAAAATDAAALRDSITGKQPGGPLDGLRFFGPLIDRILPALQSTDRNPTLTDPAALDATIERLPPTRRPFALAIAGAGPPADRARRFDRFFTG